MGLSAASKGLCLGRPEALSAPWAGLCGLASCVSLTLFSRLTGNLTAFKIPFAFKKI